MKIYFFSFFLFFLVQNLIAQLSYRPGLIQTGNKIEITATEAVDLPLFLMNGERLKVSVDDESIVVISLNTYNLLVSKELDSYLKSTVLMEQNLATSQLLLTKASQTSLQIQESSEKMMKKAWYMNALEGGFGLGLGVLIGFLLFGG